MSFFPDHIHKTQDNSQAHKGTGGLEEEAEGLKARPHNMGTE
jgi:hypothetical protein